VSEKRVIARNTLANALVKFLQLASAFVFMPFLIRGFGLAYYGLFMVAGSLSVYLALLDLGVNPTIVKRVAEFRARDDETALGRLVSNAAAYYVIVGVLVSALLVLFARFGVGLFHLTPDGAEIARNLFEVAAVIALFSWPLGLGDAVLSGLQRYELSAVVGAGVVVANLVVTAFVVVTHDGPVSLLAGVGLVSIVGGAVSTFLALRALRGVRISPRYLSPAAMGSILSFGWMLFVIQFSVLVMDQQTDRLVLATFSGAAAVGLYEAAAKLSGLVSQMAALPVSALVPASSQMDAQERPEALRALFLRGTKYTIAFAAPIAVGLMTLARPLLRTWLGAGFVSQAPAAQVLLIQWLLYLNLAVAFTVFIGTGRLTFLLRYTIVQAVLNLGFSLLLVRHLGILGVILGTVMAEAVMFPFGAAYALRELGVGLGEYVRAVVLPTYPFLLLTAGVGIGWMALGVTGTLVGVAVAGLSSVAACWVAIFAFGLEAREREDVRQLARMLARRVRAADEAA
jgi:O-antigen/teichoic acid export membrane protein